MKKTLATATLLFFTAFLNAQTLEEAPDAAKLYNEGNGLRKAGNYEGAVAKYDEALQQSNDYRIYYQKGITLKKLRNYAEAIEAFSQSVKSNPDFDLSYNGLGGTYFADGKYQEAADAFKKFEELTDKPKYKNQAKEYFARAYTKLGNNAKNDGKFDQAIKYLKEAVEKSPLDAAYLMLAEIYVDLAKFDEALTAADNALNNRKKISRGGPLYYKGKAFLGKNDVAKAREAFTAGKKDPKYAKLCDYELKQMN
ncbi:MAG: tetratricopeptide repeat protein [Ignavibacteria bacterium]|jgi:tetratricopeptide (TPR) repeat protein